MATEIACHDGKPGQHEDMLQFTKHQLPCEHDDSLSDEDVVIATKPRVDEDCGGGCHGNQCGVNHGSQCGVNHGDGGAIDEVTLSNFIVQQSLSTALQLEHQRNELLSEHKLEKEKMEKSLLTQCQCALRDMEKKVAQNGEEMRSVFEERYKKKIEEIETSLQERNTKYLEQLASQFEVQVQEREDEIRNELQQLHLTHIDSLIQQYDRERNELVLRMTSNHNEEKEAIEERNKAQCDSLRTLYEKADASRLSQEEIAMMLVNEATKHAHQLTSERESYERMIDEIKHTYETSIAEMERKQREDSIAVSNSHQKELAALMEQHDVEMTRLHDHYTIKMAAMQQQHDTHQQEMEVAVQNELLKLEVLEREKEAEFVEKVHIHEQRITEKEEQKYQELLSVKERQLVKLEQQYSNNQEEYLNQILQLQAKIEYLEQNTHQLSQHCGSLQREKQQLMEELNTQNDTIAQLKEHHEDTTTTLNVVQQQLQEERLSHQETIDVIHSNIAKVIASIQAVLPFRENHTHSASTTSSTQGDVPPIAMATPTVAMATPTVSSVKQATDTTCDSGVASQQTSGGRGLEGGVATFDDGSVIRALKLSADNARDDTDLSIYPLNDMSLDSTLTTTGSDELLNQLQTVVTLLLKTFNTTCSQVTQYHQQLGIIQNKLISSQTEHNNHLKLLEQISKENEDIKRQLHRKEAELQDYKDKAEDGDTNELVQETEKLLVQYRTLEENEREMKQQLTSAQESIASLQNELKLNNESTQDKIVSMEREITAHRSSYKDLQQRKENIEQEFTAQVESNKIEKRTLEQKLQLAEEKLVHYGNLSKEMIEKERMMEDMREQVGELQQQLVQTQHDLAMTDPHHTATLTDQVNKLQQQLQRQQLQNKEMSSELSTAKEATLHHEALEAQLTAKIDNLQESVRVKDAAIENMLSEKARVDGHCKALEEQTDTLKRQVNTLLKEMEVSGNKVNDLCQRLEEKQSQLESKEREQLDLTEQVNVLSTESTQHLKVYEQSVIRVQALQDELAQLNKKLNQHNAMVETLTVENGRLEGEVTRSKEEFQEKQEYFELQTKSLENNLLKSQKDLQIASDELTELKQQRVNVNDERISNLKREIASLQSQLMSRTADNNDELEQLQQQHKAEILQLADKLKADHAAEIALLDARLGQEYSNRDGLLQEIADLAPVLEREACEVRDLCAVESQIKKLKKLIRQKDQQLTDTASKHKLALSQVDSLKQLNQQLQQEVSETQSAMLTLEDTILKANTTITKLTTELKASTEREDTLKKQVEALEINMQRQLNACERANEELLLAEREIVAQLQQSLGQERSLCQKIQNDLVLEQNKVINMECLLNTANSEVKKYEEDNAVLQVNLDLAQQQLEEANLRARQSNMALERNIQDVKKLCQHDCSQGDLHDTIDALQRQLEQQNIQFMSQGEALAKSKETLSLLSKENMKYKQMKDSATTKLKQANGRCKGLVFQKKYLQSEIDAFYHTEQAAMMLMKDMGAPVDAIRHRKITSSHLRFRTVAITVRAAVRFSLLHRKQLRRKRKH